MDSSTPLNDIVTLVLGTSAMLVMVITIIGFAFLFQRKLIKKERAYRDIEKLLQKQELKSAYALIEGQEQERKRIATDIHDNVGNLMATLKIYSDLVLKKDQDQEMRRLNQKINDITETVTSEVRKISHSLDSGIVQNFGLKAAIDQLSEAVQSSGKIEFATQYDLAKPLTSETSLHIYRIIQELITNTLKHAKATKARLEMTQVNGEISIIFEDNGVGFDANSETKVGLGMQNIRSRISHLEGELTIHSSAIGTTFIIEIPNYPASE
jgi:signal transduction histidine kinase